MLPMFWTRTLPRKCAGRLHCCAEGACEMYTGMGHFAFECVCPGTDEVCFSGTSRFSPHANPQRPGKHHRVKSVPQGCAACIGKCRSKGLGALPNKHFATQNKQMYIRLHCLPQQCVLLVRSLKILDWRRTPCQPWNGSVKIKS